MSEYIEREALIAELAECTIISDDLYGMGIMAGIGSAMKKVSGVPASDVAPVWNGRWKVYGTRTKNVLFWMPLPEPPQEV